MESRTQNIGPAGQHKRLMGGLVALVLGATGAGVLILSRLNRWWRALLFIPFWQGALGVFQAREKT
jgi:hypothetical protein